jgi:hypothetical protein
MAKSFYDLDYIIEINEKRIEQYLSAYQKVLDRLANIILIYSAITIFLVSVIKVVFFNRHCPLTLLICFTVFVILFLLSVYNTVRLIIPVNVAYLTTPDKYYEGFRLTYEQEIQQQSEIEKLLKASYISELEKTLKINVEVFRRKSSFYYNALMYSLLSAVPYIICVGFHISNKEDAIQKIEIINSEKISNLLKINTMSNTNNNNNNPNNTQTSSANGSGTTSRLPGINNSQVIPSSPDIIKENSRHVKKK